MKKFFHYVFVVLCLIFLSPLLLAQERTVDNVKDVVCSFFTTDSGPLSRGSSATYRNNIEVTRIKRNNTTYLYAVNMPEKGWAIVSNEQRYPEIIGYSTESYFDTNLDNQPGALRLLLDHHMNMIDSLRESPSTFYDRVSHPSPLSHPLPEPNRDMDSILLKRDGHVNQWDQNSNNGWETDSCNKVYNKFCPTWYTPSCGHTYVGCTAVAIAQLAWYWKWPDYAMISDTTLMTGTPSGTVRRHYYDWDNMPCAIDNNTQMYQVDMVAGLLRDCGYAAHMLYMNTYSQAGPIKLLNALEDTYHFHVNRYFEYSWTTYNDIAQLLQYELQQKRPVICQAEKAPTDIHSFVIDGYSALTNKYHVNWGWGQTENTINQSMWDLGFDGYTTTRTFFTEIYPDCSERLESVTGIEETTIASGKDITLYSRNNVSLSQLTVENGGHLNVSVGETITLGNGFQAQLGSTVKLLPNYNCTTGASFPPVSISKRKDIDKIDSTKNTNFSVSPNPAISEINIQCEEPINTISLFNINGQEVLQTKQMQIDISHLPNGIYIIRALTKDGEILQKKLIHE